VGTRTWGSTAVRGHCGLTTRGWAHLPRGARRQTRMFWRHRAIGPAASTVATVSDLTIVNSSDHVLTVALDRRPFDLHALWLRDACSCAQCRNPSSNERLVDISTIAPDLAVQGADIRDGRLLVGLSDGHLASIGRSWLIHHLTELDRSEEPATGRRLWDARTFGSMQWFDRVALGRDEPLHRWLQTLFEVGIVGAQIEGRGESAVRDVAEMVGPIIPTNYGLIWTVDANVEPVTAVDSERSLQVHTDLPYRESAPGVQLMMVEGDSIAGGASTFVDGFGVAEHVRATDPSAWRLLTSIDFAYPFVRDDIEMHGRSPLIRLHSNGAYAQVRRAPDLVGVPFVGAADTPALYRAVRLWNELLDSQLFVIEHAVGYGEIIAWDNHRLLHGRTGFELGAHGRRVLYGCYVDMVDFDSTRSVVARRLRP
jgi:gamma-butyrobetaine dioxygenase